MLLRDLIFTPTCLGCGRFGDSLCTNCFSKLTPVHKAEIAGVTNVVCLHSYSDWLRDQIIEYKSGKYELARGLGELISIGSLQYFPNLPIVPIPTSASKLQSRGIDTVGYLAKHAKRLNRKLNIQKSLVLRKEVREQVGLTEQQRLENMRGAFIATKPIRGSVLVLDDVVTTGATMTAAATALKNAGANEVFGLGLCAAVKHGLT